MSREQSTIEAVPQDKCYGCGCCAGVCNKSAIEMKIDAEGFLRPQLEVNACNYCGLCIKVCPAMHQEPLYNIQDNIPFALWAEDSKLRLMASSGGAALLMALGFNNQGYSVLGSVFDEGFRLVKHIVADTPVDIIKTTGSKYVQSDSAAAFQGALSHPPKKYVVFGTPCQMSGLRNLIRQKHVEQNYFLVDFFCHGVPSYLLWWSFLDELTSKLGALQHLELRNKSHGWHKFAVFAIGEKGIYAKDFTRTYFDRFFLTNYGLRPTCYSCQYGQRSAADLRVGDFWGREFSDDYLGTSLAVPFTDKGLILIEGTPGLAFRSVPKNWLLESQARAKQTSLSRPADSTAVLEKLRKGKSLNDIYHEHLSSKYQKIAMKRFLYVLARALLPQRARKLLRTAKRILGG